MQREKCNKENNMNITFPSLVADELDAAWIIALWKAIHGGDLSPESIAAQAIAALAPLLVTPASALTVEQLTAGLKPFGINVTSEREKSGGSQPEAQAFGFPHTICVRFQGQDVCIVLPSGVTHTPQ